MKWTTLLHLPVLFSGAVLAELWPADMIQPLHYVGGDGGDPFSFIANDGVTVDKIRVYKKTSLVGLRVTFSDGTEQHIGNNDPESKEYNFDASRSEHITTLSLWGNGIGTRTGRIRFETSTGGVFDFGQDTTGQSEYPIEVGSGILVGFEGRAASQIDNMAFVFLRPMIKVFYDEIQYKNFDARAGLEVKSLDEQIARFDELNVTHTFKSDRIFESSRTFTKTTSNTLGASAKFVVGVPFVGNVDLTTQWSMTLASEHSETEKWTRSIGWLVLVKVASKAEEARCTAKISEGKLDLEWTGTLNMIVDAGDGVEGRHWKGPARGRVNNIDSSSTEAVCHPLLSNSTDTKRSYVGSGAARARSSLLW